MVAVQESEINLEDVNQLPERLGSYSSPVEMWQFVFEKVLRSPVRPRESSSRPLPQLVPLVPSLGKFSGVLGRPRSRWNPGRLAVYALACGVGPDDFEVTAKDLAKAIDVEEGEDDQLAVFLEQNISQLLGDQRKAYRRELDRTGRSRGPKYHIEWSELTRFPRLRLLPKILESC